MTNTKAKLECLGYHLIFSEWTVRYYSDEMRKEEMMCPDCTKKDFKVIDQKADDEPSQEPEKL
jgi:hypothetical protein